MIQGAAARYYDLLWRSRPTLEPAQWRAICDALNGTWLADVVPGGYVMPPGRMLARRRIRLSGPLKWGIDGDRLIAQLGALTPAQAESVRAAPSWPPNGDAVSRSRGPGLAGAVSLTHPPARPPRAGTGRPPRARRTEIGCQT